jgi:uncharacterized membrane protein
MSVEIFQLVSAARYLAVFFIVCCMPGLALSYLLFPPSRLDFLERFFVACSSSVALSSLLAVWLILISGQFIPLIFAAGILLLTAIFSGLALWRKPRAENGIDSGLSPDPAGKRHFIKPVLLVAILITFSLIFLPALDSHEDLNPVHDKSLFSPSDITEFYISPTEVETVLESITDPQEETEIPLVIVNHNPEPVEYRIDIFNEDQKTLEQSGITVSAGDSWRGNVTTSLPKSDHSDCIDIYLFTTSSPHPIAQLRLWN